MMTTTSPRIYVSCLASYNNGTLHGEWIDADQDADDIREAIADMLRRSPYPNVTVEHEGQQVPSAEEWAIHDFEGFEGIRLSEYESIDTVAALAHLIGEHGEAFAAWYDNQSRDGMDVEELENGFQEAYLGSYKTEADWAEEWLEQSGTLEQIPEDLRYYFDFEAYARDCRLNGDVWFHETSEGVAVFSNV